MPAAVAANMAAPKALVCSDLLILIGMFKTSAIICITNGDFLAIPPIPIIPFTDTPCFINLSTIALLPKQVDSTSERKILGASVPSVKPVTAPLSKGLASGVRLPFSQSTLSSLSSFNGICAAELLNSGIILSMILLIESSGNSDLSKIYFKGHASKFLNHAYMSPNADCPASIPIIPGITDPFTNPQIPGTYLPFILFDGATKISQVEVPMTLLK